MSYEVSRYARLGVVSGLVSGVDADAPKPDDVATVRRALAAAVADARGGATHLRNRLTSEAARETRVASLEARRRMVEQWDPRGERT
jgi:malonate decarboxylase gamma subunit